MFNPLASIGSAVSNVASSFAMPKKHEARFSADEALKHLKALTHLASHPAPDHNPVQQYILKEIERIKETAEEGVSFDVDVADTKYVALKVSPKDVSNEAVLVSAHLDTVFTGGVEDDAPSVCAMLELARGISQAGSELKNSVIFYFGADEEGDHGSHNFITQHPFGETIRVAIDLHNIFSGPGPDSSAPKHPSGQVTTQDFGLLPDAAGAIKSTVEGGISALGLAFGDKNADNQTKASGFKNPTIYIFNDGKEEGEDGAQDYSFKIRGSYNMMANLQKEEMEKKVSSSTEDHAQGIKDYTFQTRGAYNMMAHLSKEESDKNVISSSTENLTLGTQTYVLDLDAFSTYRTLPEKSINIQDLLTSGVIKEATSDDNTTTKNYKFEFVNFESLQHLGDNLLPLLL
ncbi:hypothetical protein RJT34_24710 [Clitoria ternatea]|uniref:Vacuolar membrane protease n=1 Tax=Clitoria ternatea TaxID=43366 RepID=A0AAN9II91_CLITE